MFCRQRAAFSPDSKYFAAISSDEKLLISEVSNNKFIDCKYDSSVYNTCSSLHWIPPQHKYNSPKKARISRSSPAESNLLALGTVKGDILIYNVTSKNLYSHLVGRHSDAINDMCYYQKTGAFFTCSSDKHIGVWDISSGKQISKWKADDSPVSSICVIDEKNMLSSSSSIFWWNVIEKTIIKEFVNQSTEIFKLLPVNALSLNSCYFLSAAVKDTKINAWSLSSFNCETPVASFVLPVPAEDIDISNISSKDKPLILSAVTKDGYLHLFEHALNGNVNQPIHPKVSLALKPVSDDITFVCARLSHDSESCLIAYGCSKSKVKYKNIKTRELLRKGEIGNADSDTSKSPVKLPMVDNIAKSEKNLVNGFTSLSPEDTPETEHVKTIDSVAGKYKDKLRSSNVPPSAVPDTASTSDVENKIENHRYSYQDVDLKDPKSAVEALLEALQTQNKDIIEAVFHHNDSEFISAFISNLPTTSLKTILEELSHRVCQKYSPTLCRWLKEILRIHLRYLVQHQDTLDTLNRVQKLLDSMKISKTIQKMAVLNGFLSLQMQNPQSEESDSDNENPMES